MSKLATIKTKVYDSLQNLLTGLGVAGIDKSTASHFIDFALDDTELEDAYASDWLVGKVCDLPPFDMTREWRQMDGDMVAEKLEAWEEEEKRLQYRDKIKELLTWGRVYGGAGLIIHVDDGNEPWEPLEISKIKKGSLSHLIVVDKQFLHMGRLDNNPLSINYGYPETYRLAPSSVEIHHTRVVRSVGIPLPLQSRRRNKYWGKSIIERLYSALRRAAEVQEGVGSMIHEASIDIIRVPDLMQMIANPETELELKKRFGIAKLQKSINRIMLLDSEEEYEQHNQTFSGINEIVEKYLNIVAGAADIPITRLFGQSPGGLNSTGESDLRNYYDNIRAQQETILRLKIEFIDKVIYASLFGGEATKGELDFNFNSLWQMTNEEQATLEGTRATRDQVYLDMGIIDEAVIARSLMENGTYSAVDSEYVEKIENEMKENDDNEDESEFGVMPGENDGEE